MITDRDRPGQDPGELEAGSGKQREEEQGKREAERETCRA